MRENITYVGMDTHKKEHLVAMVLPGTEEIERWSVLNQAAAIRKLVKRVQKQAPGPIEFCYEAGPCGFDLMRQIEAQGVKCKVIAPSMTPRKPGERVRTDRRDARKLVEYQRSGMLTEVHPPNEQEEAIRDLCRCRETVREDLLRAKQRLLKFLLRNGRLWGPGTHWTQKHFQWLSALRFEQKNQEFVFTEYLSEVRHHQRRLAVLDRELEKIAQEEPYREAVGVLRCFQGIDTVSALVIVSELFGFERFEHPRQLMSFLGLIPSEDSSGEKRRQGGITKTGNRRVRRILIETAWHYRHRPNPGKPLRRRRQGQPEWAIQQADQAWKRLYRRYWRLEQRGKGSAKTVVAIARELAGFLWSVLHALIESSARVCVQCGQILGETSNRETRPEVRRICPHCTQR